MRQHDVFSKLGKKSEISSVHQWPLEDDVSGKRRRNRAADRGAETRPTYHAGLRVAADRLGNTTLGIMTITRTPDF